MRFTAPSLTPHRREIEPLRPPVRRAVVDSNKKERTMPIAVQMDFPGVTLDQYDQVVEKMGLTSGGAGAPGGISHWAAKTEDGIRIVDVWQTKEQFERFAQEQIGPYAREAGFPGEPTLQFFDVHSYFTEGA
jgi:hypothetical protein